MIPTLLAIEEGEYNAHDKQMAQKLLNTITTKFSKTGQRDKISSSLGDLSKAVLGDIKGWHQAMSDVNTLKDIVETFLITFFEQHFNTDVTSTKAFQQHFKKERERDILYKR
jgi:hypothetical protein